MSKPAKSKKSAKATLPTNEQEFVKHFLEQIAPEDWAALGEKAARDLARVHLRLMTERKEGESKIAFRHNHVAGSAWDDRRTYLDIVADDQPFLIDSVAALLADRRLMIDMLLHPRVNVCYDDHHRPVFDMAGLGRQTHLHIVVRGNLTAGVQAELQAEILSVIADVNFATRDWQAMRVRAIEAKQYLLGCPKDLHGRDELNEFAELLDYLYDNNFTFLGCRSYRFKRANGKLTSQVIEKSGLGLLADDRYPAYLSETGEPLPARLQELRTRLPALHISKVNRTSTVHRRVPMDAVGVLHFNDKGEVVGETLFIGLFTSVTYSRSLRSIPLLKYKADMVLRASGFEPVGHDGRALRHILEKYPRDELFQIEVDQLYHVCLSILRLQERQRIALYCRRDPFDRYVSCLVYVPRDRFDTRLRLKFQGILEKEFMGTCTNFNSSVDDSPLVRILYTIAVSQKQPKTLDVGAIEEKLQQAGRVWGDLLADALHRVIDNDVAADQLIARYMGAFSADYCERYSLAEAVHDIGKIEACLSSQSLELDLEANADEAAWSLKLYTAQGALVLSDILPILENMGLRVFTEHPFAVTPMGATAPVMVQDFTVVPVGLGSKGVDLVRLKPRFESAFAGVMAGAVENDTLNALVIRAGLACEDVVILRSYVRYLRQTALPFSLPYMEQAVVAYPAIAEMLVGLFRAMFEPTRPKGTRSVEAWVEDISRALEGVAALDHDRILRGLFEVMRATLRTNFFQGDKAGAPKSYLSIKLDSRAISFLPDPKPYREIFVYSPRMEGIHLRSGRIARGGIRWSDRAEDFRTEVLGLMKAQTVKNSVIVPSGAKGGFIVKRPPVGGDRAAIQVEGIECYRTLIRGLLDITDNIGKGNKIIKPRDVTCRDPDDPYLVVAADKGTATFSDIANALSLEYGFWMGDGFASGGSAGYDHKAMGITARGAWESVKRHFREIGRDTQSQAFDVIGVGDMGGDVFGNGMLLSPFICLVGAFNHAHIFCDPNPDAASSFAERKRMFKGVLGWDGYNTKLLSKGGRIYSRKEKVLELTPEIQKRFDISKARVTPPELIQAMLRARVDLLYLGGIGTYVKASAEAHADVGDRSNDALRINAADIRALVVGEGANLGFTQRARIEYAGAGGRLNADFVDNSAGVDTSDHEVNIKILTATVMAKSPARLTRATRDKMLKGMTDEVAALVLADNYQQTQAISLIQSRAAESLSAHQRFIQDMTRLGAMDRALEFLPDDKEIAERQKVGRGLTRPEIGIILSYAKLRLREDLLATRLPDRNELDPWLIDYFPTALRKKFRADILAHPLRREIIATQVTNTMVNRLGPDFVREAMETYNVGAEAVANAFIAGVEILDLRTRWAMIEALDSKVKAAAQLSAFTELAKLLKTFIAWFVAEYGDRAQAAALVKNWGRPVAELSGLLLSDKAVRHILVPEQVDSLGERFREWQTEGFVPEAARLLATRSKLAQAPRIMSLAVDMKEPIDRVAHVYYPLGHHFGFSWLRTQMDHLPKTSRWSAEAAHTLAAQIDSTQVELARSVLAPTGAASARRVGADAKKLPDLYAVWLAQRGSAVDEVLAMLADLKRVGAVDLTMVMVLLQRIRRLI